MIPKGQISTSRQTERLYLCSASHDWLIFWDLKQSFLWQLRSFLRKCFLLVDKLAFFLVFYRKKVCQEFPLDITNKKLYLRKRNGLINKGLSLFFFLSIFNKGWTLYYTCRERNRCFCVLLRTIGWYLRLYRQSFYENWGDFLDKIC